MEFTIVKDEKLEGCYGAGKIFADGKELIAFVSEAEGNGKIVAVDPATLLESVISDKPGGGMNIVPLLKEDGSFLAIQGFYPVFKSENACVVWGRRAGGKYIIKEALPLPFVHRIDVISYNGDDYLIAASLCEKKKFTDDWDYPGSVYAGKIDYRTQSIADFHPIRGGIFKNHGFAKLGQNGENGILISGECGVIRMISPKSANGTWSEEILIPTPASDAVVADIDGDGTDEIGVLSPFHGGEFHIYKLINNVWSCIYSLSGHEFGHAVWGGEFNGKQAFIVGYRAAGMELYLIARDGGEFKEYLIDRNAGPANVTVVKGIDGDYICAANRQADKYTIYKQKNWPRQR